MLKYFIIYLSAINLIAFFTMYNDKVKSQKNKWRTPEKTLFVLALLGGVIGIYSGMKRFKHKTKKWHFKYGIPLIGIVYIAIITIVVIKSW